MPEVEARDTVRVEFVKADWLQIDPSIHGRHIRLFELSIPSEMDDREAVEFAGRIIEAGWGGPVYSTFGMISRSFATPEDPTRTVVSVSVDEKVIDMKPSEDSHGVMDPEEARLRQLVEAHYRGPFERPQIPDVAESS